MAETFKDYLDQRRLKPPKMTEEQARHGGGYSKEAEKVTGRQGVPFEDWLYPGNEWAEVESSNVAAILYDHAARKLHVKFKGSGGGAESHYVYHAVQPETARQMYHAQSMGQFVHRRLKGRFAYDKVG